MPDSVTKDGHDCQDYCAYRDQSIDDESAHCILLCPDLCEGSENNQSTYY